MSMQALMALLRGVALTDQFGDIHVLQADGVPEAFCITSRMSSAKP